MTEKKRPRGRPKSVWTAERRKAVSERMKKVWAEASPEKKARMHTNWQSNGFEKRTHEEMVAIQAKVDKEAKAKKLSATRKAKFASGEYDYLRVLKSIQHKEWWAKLPPEEYERRVQAFKNGIRLKGKHKEPELKPEETKEYNHERYRAEQERLYQMAKNCLAQAGIEPKPKQPIGYYRVIIEFFHPEWVDWELSQN